MPYCVADDVRVELGLEEAFSATSIPTDTQVTTIISQVEGVINVNLVRAGVTPSAITDADQLLYLADLCVKGATCRVGMTYFGNSTNVDNTQPTFWCDEFKRIVDDTDLLAEIFTPSSDGGIFENQVTNGTVAESDIPNITDKFIY